MVQLLPMSQRDFDLYFETAIDFLATELSKARDLSLDDGRKAAEASFKGLFPEGQVDSQDQYVFHVMAEGKKVGLVHFGIKRDKKDPYLYLWDIVIDSEYRGKGYGKSTMAALENVGRKLGISKIRLNVFGHNAPAIALYEAMGYRPESLAMMKGLSGG